MFSNAVNKIVSFKKNINKSHRLNIRNLCSVGVCVPAKIANIVEHTVNGVAIWNNGALKNRKQICCRCRWLSSDFHFVRKCIGARTALALAVLENQCTVSCNSHTLTLFWLDFAADLKAIFSSIFVNVPRSTYRCACVLWVFCVLFSSPLYHVSSSQRYYSYFALCGGGDVFVFWEMIWAIFSL